MKRLNGITKAAKRACGKSYQCEKCPIKKSCNLEMMRACFDSFIDGFKKGAHFANNTPSINRKEKEAVKMFDKDFGTDLNMRLVKLEEETGELKQAISMYNAGLDGIDAVKDEMSDVLAVITHVCSILGTNVEGLFDDALDKIVGRKTDPDYKRTHPHIKNRKGGDK